MKSFEELLQEQEKTKQRYLASILGALRDVIHARKEDMGLPAEFAFTQMTELFRMLEIENPSIKQINELRSRIQELAQQNREFRKQLGLPEEELRTSY